MPRTRFMAELTAPDAAALQAVRSLVNAELPPAGKIFDKPFDWDDMLMVPSNDFTGAYRGSLDVRFKAKTDGTKFFDSVVGLVPQVVALGCSGRVSIHDCTHDDPVIRDCRDDPQSNWREEVF